MPILSWPHLHPSKKYVLVLNIQFWVLLLFLAGQGGGGKKQVNMEESLYRARWMGYRKPSNHMSVLQLISIYIKQQQLYTNHGHNFNLIKVSCSLLETNLWMVVSLTFHVILLCKVLTDHSLSWFCEDP